MPTPVYEIRVRCDNCGCLVSRQEVEEATFTRLAVETTPAIPTLVDEDDIVEEEQVRPVEVLYQHIARCRSCA